MNTPLAKFQTAMSDPPLVAILRGLTPAEAPAIGDALVEIGFRLEVPLNSPQRLESIALLRARFPQALVGAGTVLRAQVSEFGVQYRPYRERVLQIINDIRKEEGLPQLALQ
jgi:2-keto-3-deoxy-6-phosphogluconate aldolase